MSALRHRVQALAAVAALAAIGCKGGSVQDPWHGGGHGEQPGAAGGGAVVPGETAPEPAVPPDCSQPTLAPRRVWRLTAKQYDNTLKDLFGKESTFGAGFPADDIGVGFSNGADSLLMSPLLADKLSSAAQDTSDAAELQRFTSCTSSDDKCLSELVTRFGERAFRRPLTQPEIDRYLALAKAPGNFDQGARLAINTMLQSPYFLYRFELGQPSKTAASGTYELDDYEIASELSYTLWQTMPDDTLMAAAKGGQLHDKAQLAMQAARMMKDPRAQAAVRNFVMDWLGLSTIMTVPKDTNTFPDLTQDVRAAMVKEAERFVDGVMFGATPDANGTIAAILNGDGAMLDDALAKFYGGGATTAGVPATQERRGVLTLGGVMLVHSRSNDSSPIHRGKLVRERLLCQPLPPPPPGLVLQPPGLDATKTTRERYAAHSENAYCESCHRLMDPIGLAFEHFDGVGRFRTDDHGLPIDVSGEVKANESKPTDADGAFMGTDGLIDKLEVSQDVRRCYALEWFRFAYGEGKTERESKAYPSCQAQRFEDVVAQTPGTLTDLINTLVQSDWFTTRGGPDPSTLPPLPATTFTPSTPAAQQPTAAAGGPAPAVPADLQVTKTVDNDWGMGYCYTYELKNTGTMPITWSVPLDVRGTMNNHWECNVSGETGPVTFTGADHNKTIDPGMTAQFGYCGTTGM